MSKPTKPSPGEVQNALRASWRGSTESLNRAWDSCLEEMLTLFYPPFRAADDVEMLELSVKGIRAYAEDLADLPEHVLRKAWREVRRHHKVERWPTIEAILSAARDGSGPSHRAGGRRQATDAELEYQRVAYGQVCMNLVTDDDVHHHRRQAEDKRQGVKGGYNPFAGKRAA